MQDLDQTRQSLLLRLAQCSDSAWEEFVSVYEQSIYRFCRSVGLQDAEALDATQNVLLAVYKKIDQWNHDPTKGKFRGWLLRVARNIAVDEVRRRKRGAVATGDSSVHRLLDNVSKVYESESTAFAVEYRKALFHWAAQRVKPEVKESTWRAFWLAAVNGESPEQIAKRLEMSIGAVYTAKCRVVTRIRKVLREADDQEITDLSDISFLIASNTPDHKPKPPSIG